MENIPNTTFPIRAFSVVSSNMSPFGYTLFFLSLLASTTDLDFILPTTSGDTHL